MENYKRVLRTSDHKRWQPVKLTEQKFYEQLYRLDGCEDDWAPLVGGASSSKGPPPAPSAGETDMDSCRYEWLRATLRVNEYYSCPVTRSEPHGGGVVDVRRETEGLG